MRPMAFHKNLWFLGALLLVLFAVSYQLTNGFGRYAFYHLRTRVMRVDKWTGQKWMAEAGHWKEIP